jgi:NAD(P)-dependent dehydrogenase (short-subunit alcohol dehydrogenase family)
VAQEGAKIMLQQGSGGRIIFTTSVGAFRSNGTQTHYCTTKGGQNLLMQGMALELAPHGITVNAVAPGWIHTDINDGPSRDPDITGPWIRSRCAAGRLGQVEDLKGAYLLLASKEASYINGSTITVDGGWLAQL